MLKPKVSLRSAFPESREYYQANVLFALAVSVLQTFMHLTIWEYTDVQDHQ